MIVKNLAAILVFTVYIASSVEGKTSRCFQCRSRGGAGDCKDPFTFNDTDVTRGITTGTCSSQWCVKFIEGISGPPDEFGTAVERDCLSIPPSDNEERCAETLVRNKPTLVCFCRGDLCNAATSTSVPTLSFMSLVAFALYKLF